MGTNRRLALLIDGDNAQASLMPEIWAATSKYGTITMCRVYGDLTKPHMANWIETQPKYELLKLMQQANHSKSKNATDMALVIDAMDILHTKKEINGFCIASNDGDYAPLAEHLQNRDLFVLGIGTKKASQAFVKACKGKFVYVGKPQNGTQSKVSKSLASPPTANNTTMPKDLRKLLKKAIDAASESDGWASISAVGQQLHNDPEFKARTTSPKKLSKILETYSNDFDTDPRKSKKGNNVTYIRLKAASKSAK